MSKIGKTPIIVPEGVAVTVQEERIAVKGKLGELTVPRLPHVNAELRDGRLVVHAEEGEVQARANWGTLAALLRNAIRGVTEGFSKTLEIEGIGFRASLEGTTLVLNLGFAHQVKFTPPKDVVLSVDKNQIKVTGIDKQAVGLVASQIRALKKPEPYKGKGIHYLGEVIRRKATKKVAGTASGA